VRVDSADFALIYVVMGEHLKCPKNFVFCLEHGNELVEKVEYLNKSMHALFLSVEYIFKGKVHPKNETCVVTMHVVTLMSN